MDRQQSSDKTVLSLLIASQVGQIFRHSGSINVLPGAALQSVYNSLKSPGILLMLLEI